MELKSKAMAATEYVISSNRTFMELKLKALNLCTLIFKF